MNLKLHSKHDIEAKTFRAEMLIRSRAILFTIMEMVPEETPISIEVVEERFYNIIQSSGPRKVRFIP